jgi:hypothetical protein
VRERQGRGRAVEAGGARAGARWRRGWGCEGVGGEGTRGRGTEVLSGGRGDARRGEDRGSGDAVMLCGRPR